MLLVEWYQGMKELGFELSDRAMQQIILRLDQDGDGTIEYHEFVTFAQSAVMQHATISWQLAGSTMLTQATTAAPRRHRMLASLEMAPPVAAVGRQGLQLEPELVQELARVVHSRALLHPPPLMPRALVTA